VWPGDGVIYSQRLSSLRTKSRLNRVLATPEYRYMTIRNWNTTTRLQELLRSLDAGRAEVGAWQLQVGHTGRSPKPKRRKPGA